MPKLNQGRLNLQQELFDLEEKAHHYNWATQHLQDEKDAAWNRYLVVLERENATLKEKFRDTKFIFGLVVPGLTAGTERWRKFLDELEQSVKFYIRDPAPYKDPDFRFGDVVGSRDTSDGRRWLVAEAEPGFPLRFYHQDQLNSRRLGLSTLYDLRHSLPEQLSVFQRLSDTEEQRRFKVERARGEVR